MRLYSLYGWNLHCSRYFKGFSKYNSIYYRWQAGGVVQQQNFKKSLRELQDVQNFTAHIARAYFSTASSRGSAGQSTNNIHAWVPPAECHTKKNQIAVRSDEPGRTTPACSCNQYPVAIILSITRWFRYSRNGFNRLIQLIEISRVISCSVETKRNKTR